VSTRKLIGLALLCGLAILVAGGIQLFRIADARDEPIDVLTVGQAGTVQGVTATVSDVHRSGPIVLAVDVSASSGSNGVDDLASAWLVTSDGRAREPVAVPDGSGTTCPADRLPAGARSSCVLAFEAADGEAFARFRIGDEVLVWGLDGTGEGGQ
jgi:hypothetical protein